MTPTRYTLNDPNGDSTGPTAAMLADPKGAYVLWADYQKVRAALAGLVGVSTKDDLLQMRGAIAVLKPEDSD